MTLHIEYATDSEQKREGWNDHKTMADESKES